jgi:hypothetical protein
LSSSAPTQLRVFTYLTFACWCYSFVQCVEYCYSFFRLFGLRSFWLFADFSNFFVLLNLIGLSNFNRIRLRVLCWFYFCFYRCRIFAFPSLNTDTLRNQSHIERFSLLLDRLALAGVFWLLGLALEEGKYLLIYVC